MRLDLGLQSKLVRIRNEVKARKMAAELAYSSVLWPENTPTASWSGTVEFTSMDYTTARFRARFTRSDGAEIPPAVDFAAAVTITPSYVDHQASIGMTRTGDDPNAVESLLYAGYVAAVGNNYTDYYIDLTELPLFYRPLTEVQASITVEAISTTEGTLTLERLI